MSQEITSSNLVCNLCNNPTFLCNCDTQWTHFNSILENDCKGKTLENVNYTSLRISTMTVCFRFTQSINLQLLKEKLPPSIKVYYKPGSKKSKVPKKKGTDAFYNSFEIKLSIKDHEQQIYSNVSIFFFPNGKAKAAGLKTIQTINILLDEMIELVKYVPESAENCDTLGVQDVKIQMICSDFKIKPIKDDPDGWCINQKKLKNILKNEYNYSATFSALSRYPGINLKIESVVEDDKQISLLIFRSGSIIITAAKNAQDLANCYKIITNIITKHYDELFYFDINEEIKQKKKKR